MSTSLSFSVRYTGMKGKGSLTILTGLLLKRDWYETNWILWGVKTLFCIPVFPDYAGITESAMFAFHNIKIPSNCA